MWEWLLALAVSCELTAAAFFASYKSHCCHHNSLPAGVLIRGWDILPNAKEALRKVHDSGVPYLFVTNNGMDTEAERAKILTKQFDIPVTTKNMVLNHSALQVGAQLAQCRPEGHSW